MASWNTGPHSLLPEARLLHSGARPHSAALGRCFGTAEHELGTVREFENVHTSSWTGWLEGQGEGEVMIPDRSNAE